MKEKPLSAISPSAGEDIHRDWERVVRRRSFLKGIGLAGAALPAGSLLKGESTSSNKLNQGDLAIVRFLAAVEIIETDLWQQYDELGGVNGGNPAYMAALSNLDGDMPQYISDNTDDEISHMKFLNGYLKSNGEDEINLDHFRTLLSSRAQGAQDIKRLTNLRNLTVDTSLYTRHRSKQNRILA